MRCTEGFIGCVLPVLPLELKRGWDVGGSWFAGEKKREGAATDRQPSVVQDIAGVRQADHVAIWLSRLYYTKRPSMYSRLRLVFVQTL